MPGCPDGSILQLSEREHYTALYVCEHALQHNGEPINTSDQWSRCGSFPFINLCLAEMDTLNIHLDIGGREKMKPEFCFPLAYVRHRRTRPALVGARSRRVDDISVAKILCSTRRSMIANTQDGMGTCPTSVATISKIQASAIISGSVLCTMEASTLARRKLRSRLASPSHRQTLRLMYLAPALFSIRRLSTRSHQPFTSPCMDMARDR